MDDSLTDDQLRELSKLAVDAARCASELILGGFRSPGLAAEKKSDGSPVTQFDREAERSIRAFIQRHQPHDWPVLGEEFGGDTERARYRWVVDPIDGTLGYSRGLPNFGTLLAFEEVAARRALVGVIHLPAMHETYWAARGAGAWCGAERIHVAPPRELRDCIVSAPAQYQFALAGIADSHTKLRARAPHLRCFADCWAHAMVARGPIDALAEFNLARWDIAASEVIIVEAGGAALIRDARDVRGKYDIILGSPSAAADVAQLLEF
ncbi:MAG: inositol monophosphatase family protein [Steroidobacteraceae bacterium]